MADSTGIERDLTDTRLCNPIELRMITATSPEGHEVESPSDVPSVPQARRLSADGCAGLIDDSDGERPDFVHWVGFATTAAWIGSSPGQTVRVAPAIKWEAFWSLSVAGLGSAIADAEGGVNLKVFGPNNQLVAEHGLLSLFSDHHDGGGLSWDTKEGYLDGNNPSMHLWFPIPGGETRWISIDAYVKLRTGYNDVTDAAAASCGLAVTVNFVVLDPS